MGATIEGKGRVWAKDHDGWTSYTIGVSSKAQDGTWINAYQPIRFKKGVKVDNGTDINYKGFATVVKGKEKNFVIWQITEYRLAGDDTARPTEDNFTALTTDDIPF